MKEEEQTWIPFEVLQITGLVTETSEHRKVLFPFMGHVFSAGSVSAHSTEVFLNFPARQPFPEQAVVALNM